VIHFNITEHPTEAWTAQQIIEAFPEDQAPRYLIRDRDGICGEYFQHRVQGMGIREVRTAPRSLWQNPYVEKDDRKHTSRVSESFGRLQRQSSAPDS
jgi:hypothetical protein